MVAPHTGAWIETVIVSNLRAWLKVAPHTGAWIEIFDIGISMSDAACFHVLINTVSLKLFLMRRQECLRHLVYAISPQQ
ncbi:MAG: hypothetical protein WCP12_04525 [bacterium]